MFFMAAPIQRNYSRCRLTHSLIYTVRLYSTIFGTFGNFGISAPLEVKIKTWGFDQSSSALHDFVLTDTIFSVEAKK